MFETRQPVIYQRRRFIIVGLLPNGRVVIEDDEGEQMTVRLEQLRPA